MKILEESAKALIHKSTSYDDIILQALRIEHQVDAILKILGEDIEK